MIISITLEINHTISQHIFQSLISKLDLSFGLKMHCHDKLHLGTKTYMKRPKKLEQRFEIMDKGGTPHK